MASGQIQACLYHKNSSKQAEAGHKLLSKVKVPSGSSVLDLGCGTGCLATVLSEMVGPEGRVVAVDPDAERIGIAKENNARLNIEYLVGDDQSFPGVEYALIVSNYVIHWIKNKEALFTRLYNKLAAGGQFAFATKDGTPEFPPNSIMKRALDDLVSPDFVATLLKKKWSFQNTIGYQILAEFAGFEITSAIVETSYYQWTSVDDVLNFFAAISQGDINRDSINQKALQEFKERHEKQLLTEKVPYYTLHMVLTKV